MSAGKPIHVQVAEVLGWTDCHEIAECYRLPFAPRIPWYGDNPSLKSKAEGGTGKNDVVPYYDTDWAAAGPLIEAFGILIAPNRWSGHTPLRWVAAWPGDAYAAIPREGARVSGPQDPYLRTVDGPMFSDEGDPGKPLLAVCALILELGKAGKLKRP